MRIFVGAIVVLLLCPLIEVVYATTYTAAACNGSADHSKVQTAVNSATDGDTVQIQAGTCTFTGSVTVSDKNIVIQGAGESQTTITSNAQWAFNFTGLTKAGWRVTALTINSNSNGAIQVYCFDASAVLAGRFRIDHITTNITGGGDRTIRVECVAYGLIDHWTANYSAGSGIINAAVHYPQNVNDNYAGGGLAGDWLCANDTVVLGSDKAVYIEDSTITAVDYSGINDSLWCGRMVWRHNTFSGPFHLQTHSARGQERGGAHSEYYNNHYTCNAGAGCPGFANMRSGTGVVFNNTIQSNGGNFLNKSLVMDFQRCSNAGGCSVISAPTNGCSTSSGYDEGTESNGWPCFDQPGWSGPLLNQSNGPIYVWNNGDEDGCSNGGSCGADFGITINCEGEGNVGAKMEDYIKTTTHSNGMKDYCVGTTTMPSSCGTHTNTYTPYTYPHPLQGATAAPRFSPSFLRRVSQEVEP